MSDEKRVLVVDDEKDNRDMMKDRINSQPGLEEVIVDTAEDGEFALEKVKEKKYNIIILDYKMQYMGGIRTYLNLKKMNLHQNTVMFSSDISDLKKGFKKKSDLSAKELPRMYKKPEEIKALMQYIADRI